MFGERSNSYGWLEYIHMQDSWGNASTDGAPTRFAFVCFLWPTRQNGVDSNFNGVFSMIVTRRFLDDGLLGYLELSQQNCIWNDED